MSNNEFITLPAAKHTQLKILLQEEYACSRSSTIYMCSVYFCIEVTYTPPQTAESKVISGESMADLTCVSQ